MLNKYLEVNPEVAEALAAGKPVVALESTIISHGMPYPQNVNMAREVERIIRENGAVPATIGIIGGKLKAGLTAEELEYFAKNEQKILDMINNGKDTDDIILEKIKEAFAGFTAWEEENHAERR